jgi:hypothetical protein
VAASVLPLAGCRWGPADEVDGATEVEAGADEALVDKAVAAILEQADLVRSVSDRHLGLAGALAPLLAAHTAHAAVLTTNEPDRAATVAPARESSRAALARVRRRETMLQAELAGYAADAVSGSLARALASMSASIAQHLAAFPTLQEGPA